MAFKPDSEIIVAVRRGNIWLTEQHPSQAPQQLIHASAYVSNPVEANCT